MTNEEKTNEVCCKDCTVGTICKQKGHCEMYKAVLRVCAWKQEQMIEKAVEWLNNNTITTSNDLGIIYTTSSYNISKEKFIECFKQAMEE